MKIALAQIDTTVGDFAGNLALVESALERARREGVDLVVFPEQTLPGYPAEDLLERRDFQAAADAALDRARRACHGVGMVIGALRRAPGERGNPVYNTAVLVDDGKIIAEHHKVLLPTYDVFDEARYFRRGPTPRICDFRGRRLGLAVCEDFWNDAEFWEHQRYNTDPIEELVAAGAEMLVGISASPYSLGRPAFRRRMLASAARRHGVPIVYSNLVGGNTTLVFDGASFALDRDGNLLVAAPGFEESFDVFELDDKPLVDVPAGLEAEAEQDESDAAVEQAYGALVLGTRDYMRKSGFRRAVLGLSGGVDSALTAAVAAEAIGPENVIGVALPSRYSSSGSLTDAQRLAENLGIAFRRISIEKIFAAALETLAPVFEGLEADVTEENIQARARGLLLMALSNKFGALLLTTGNKSELAVGYCTLYGDMSGGLAVISDVPKTLVWRICRWLNRDREVIPPATIDKPPSAELRPDQKDEDSLPPYDVLDAVLEAYVEEHAGVDAMVARGFDRKVVEEVVRLVDRNEYKRKQAAPGLRITSKAFGPGRRVPIVQRWRP